MNKLKKIADEFRKVGNILFERELVDLRGGNVSVRSGKNSIIIKKTGISMPFITTKDIIRLPIYKVTKKDKIASSDLDLHRKIYVHADQAQKSVNAVLHSHIPEAVALSSFLDKFTPQDYEGKIIISVVPIIEYDLVPEYCIKYNICIVKGHGVFAVGKNLKEALSLTLTLAHSLRISFLSLILKNTFQQS